MLQQCISLLQPSIGKICQNSEGDDLHWCPLTPDSEGDHPLVPIMVYEHVDNLNISTPVFKPNFNMFFYSC